MNVMRQGALTFCILVIAGCSKLDPNGTLNGSIFIVTKGGESVKLGAVEVKIIAEKDFAAYLKETKPGIDSLRSDLEREYRSISENKGAALQAAAKANVALAQVKTIYDQAKAQAKAAYDQAKAQAGVPINEDLVSLSRYAYDPAKAQIQDTYDQAKAKANAVYNQALVQPNVALAQAQAKADDADKLLAGLETRRSKWVYDVTEIYLRKLPPADASAVTDADGKFSVKIPRSGRFVAIAKRQRLVAGSTEQYYWFVWVSLDGQKSKTIMLINQNLIDTSCPDCIAMPSPPALSSLKF